MNNIRVLEFYELFKSDLIKKVGPRAGMTDLCKITGENRSLSSNGSYYIEGQNGNIAIVNPCGFIKTEDEYLDNTGIRPVIDLDNIDINNLKKVGEDGLPIVEFGKYPTSLVDEHTKDILDTLYSIEKLDRVREYTLGYKSVLITNIDNVNKYEDFEIDYKEQYPCDADGYDYDCDTVLPDDIIPYPYNWFPKLPNDIDYKYDIIPSYKFNDDDNYKYEYVINKNREASINKYDSYSFDNNEYVRFIHDEKVYWLKVEPVLWYVDTSINALISKDILIRGIDTDSNNIKDSNILEYMNQYMYKDMGIENKYKKIKTYSL